MHPRYSLKNQLFKAFFVASVLVVAVGAPYILLAAEESPAMFIEAPIWFSEEPKEGETVTIETAILNSATKTLTGVVSFYDDKTLLGKTAITIPSRGVRIASTTWKVTSGDHRIFAELSQAKITDGSKTITLASVATDTVKKNVTHAISVAPPRPDREGTPEGKQLEIVDALQEKVTDFLPESVQSTFAKVDDFRETSAENAAVWKVATQEKIDAHKDIAAESANVKDTATSTSEETTEDVKPFSPFTYVELFLATILAFVLDNYLLTYGIGIGIILLIARALFNKISG
jgi:hypothetical protein